MARRAILPVRGSRSLPWCRARGASSAERLSARSARSGGNPSRSFLRLAASLGRLMSAREALLSSARRACGPEFPNLPSPTPSPARRFPRRPRATSETGRPGTQTATARTLLRVHRRFQPAYFERTPPLNNMSQSPSGSIDDFYVPGHLARHDVPRDVAIPSGSIDDFYDSYRTDTTKELSIAMPLYSGFNSICLDGSSGRSQSPAGSIDLFHLPQQ